MRRGGRGAGGFLHVHPTRTVPSQGVVPLGGEGQRRYIERGL